MTVDRPEFAYKNLRHAAGLRSERTTCLLPVGDLEGRETAKAARQAQQQMIKI
jgi:hypothetical protein